MIVGVSLLIGWAIALPFVSLGLGNLYRWLEKKSQPQPQPAAVTSRAICSICGRKVARFTEQNGKIVCMIHGVK